MIVIGLGEDGWSGLSSSAREMILSAEVLVGSERHFELVHESLAAALKGRENQPNQVTWERPFSAMMERLLSYRKKTRVVILASGNPMCFGVGASFARRLPKEEMFILPQPSAFDLMAARMAWPLTGCETLTIHGRSVAGLIPSLYDRARLLILSRDEKSPGEVAFTLCKQGFGPSKITVFEHMGGPHEKSFEGTATDWKQPEGASFNAMAVECVLERGRRAFSIVAGLPDDAFLHDGKMTKRLARAATLSALQPFPDQVLWDLGAGSGSVAIEWLRAAPRSKAVAVERDEKRLSMIAQNALNLGVPHLEIIKGNLPDIFDDLHNEALFERPDAIFIGGGATANNIIELCWKALKADGRLVANAVTLEGEASVIAWHRVYGGELYRLSVQRASPVGPFRGWRPAMPVTQYCVVKENDK